MATELVILTRLNLVNPWKGLSVRPTLWTEFLLFQGFFLFFTNMDKNSALPEEFFDLALQYITTRMHSSRGAVYGQGVWVPSLKGVHLNPPPPLWTDRCQWKHNLSQFATQCRSVTNTHYIQYFRFVRSYPCCSDTWYRFRFRPHPCSAQIGRQCRNLPSAPLRPHTRDDVMLFPSGSIVLELIMGTKWSNRNKISTSISNLCFIFSVCAHFH